MTIVYQLVLTAWRNGEPYIMSSPVVYSTWEKAMAAIPAFAEMGSSNSDDPIAPDAVTLRKLELK